MILVAIDIPATSRSERDGGIPFFCSASAASVMRRIEKPHVRSGDRIFLSCGSQQAKHVVSVSPSLAIVTRISAVFPLRRAHSKKNSTLQSLDPGLHFPHRVPQPRQKARKVFFFVFQECVMSIGSEELTPPDALHSASGNPFRDGGFCKDHRPLSSRVMPGNNKKHKTIEHLIRATLPLL